MFLSHKRIFMKAFIGTGLLGSAFVKAMLGRGDKVHVWNRTFLKAQALESFGAEAFEDIKDAVADADLIHVALRDDATVDEVLEKAAAGFAPGAIIVDHTTTSVEGAIGRTAAWKAKGFTYLHAPVLMGPQNALDATGVMLVSGNQDVIDTLESALEKMTGKVLNFGDVEGKAAGIKLIANLYYLTFTTGLSDALLLGKSLDIPTADIETLFSSWNAGSMANGQLKHLLAGHFDDASWELPMARKDAGLMIAEAEKAGNHLVTTSAIAAEMDNWIAKGHTKDDWTVIASDSIS